VSTSSQVGCMEKEDDKNKIKKEDES